MKNHHCQFCDATTKTPEDGWVSYRQKLVHRNPWNPRQSGYRVWVCHSCRKNVKEKEAA